MGLQSVRSILQLILCSERFNQRGTVLGCVSTWAGLLIAYLLLETWCRILKQLTVALLVTKFPDFIGNRRLYYRFHKRSPMSQTNPFHALPSHLRTALYYRFTYTRIFETISSLHVPWPKLPFNLVSHSCYTFCSSHHPRFDPKMYGEE
jgi:hypothetical protein